MRAHSWTTIAILLCTTACTHDLSAQFGAEAQAREADALLAQAQFGKAREAYRMILTSYPDDPHALFGAVLTDLLTVGEWAPVTAVVSGACHQDVPLDVGGLLFGPGGLIAQSVRAREGDAMLTAHYFGNALDGALNLQLAPDDVRSGVDGPTTSDPRRTLSLRVHERNRESPRWLDLTVNVDDVHRDDELATPLVDGVEVDLERLAGSIDLTDFGNGRDRQGTPTGRLRFVKAGLVPGQQLVVELIGVRLPGPVPASCSGVCPAGWYTVEGRIEDTISPRLDLDPTRVPWADLRRGDGPVVASDEVLAFETCDRFDDRFLAAQALEATDLMEADALLLERLLASPDQGRFAFALPASLLRSAADLPVNLTDVRALRGWLLAAAALLEIGAEYRWLAGDIQAQIEEHDWYGPGDTELPGRARVFWPATLAMSLETGFLTQPPEFDLSRARQRLKVGLGELRVALGERPQQDGLFDFAAAPSARLVGEIAGALGAFEQSIDSADPIAIPTAPLHTVHLAAYFDAPLDAARVRQVAGLLRIWSAREGDPQSLLTHERNPRLAFELELGDVRTWSSGAISYPPTYSDVMCSSGAGCPSGYTCEDPECVLVAPWFSTEDAWQLSSRGDWPAFVGGALRDALDVDL